MDIFIASHGRIAFSSKENLSALSKRTAIIYKTSMSKRIDEL